MNCVAIGPVLDDWAIIGADESAGREIAASSWALPGRHGRSQERKDFRIRGR